MEIRIIVEQLDPPGGRLSVVAEASPGQHLPGSAALCFTGWLGLKALYEVTGTGGGEPRSAAPPRRREQ